MQTLLYLGDPCLVTFALVYLPRRMVVGESLRCATLTVPLALFRFSRKA